MVFAFMKRPPIFGRMFCVIGAYNGYVGLTPDEKKLPVSWQGVHGNIDENAKTLDDMVDVHGGITFDELEASSDFKDRFSVEVALTDIPESFEGCRIIGFDTCHYNDGPHHNEEWCKRETMSLYNQIVELLKKEEL
jgi:hypothetical protein